MTGPMQGGLGLPTVPRLLLKERARGNPDTVNRTAAMITPAEDVAETTVHAAEGEPTTCIGTPPASVVTR